MAKRLLEQEQDQIDRERREEAYRNEQAVKNMINEDKKIIERELEMKTYQCFICFDEHPIEKIYTLDECFHRFCNGCLEQHFSTQIFNGGVKNIRCPDPDCGRLVSYHEVKHNVDTSTLSKYEEFLLQISLSEDPNFRTCPRSNCNTALIGDPDAPMIVCPKESCKFAYCFNCKDAWHSDITCEQYKRWKEENDQAERKFQEWSRANTKPCPKCNSKIEKNGGCNHMTCKRCSHEFCWLCLEIYNKQHYSSSKCKQFS
ncbi:hypothetical protein DICPUDRAFT_43095 [Dictyostelium purpureum]|uniref:RBR-type E3 ubiquitin transferase n=1 Tax=Dictyostelium purpureum TaxID=5786 RepID=F1A3H0_DICPU|nr:uncharacterized protein DICPUDRAFT_43095 [Dictyostelium purpureum]EGC29258.1 hypothetical protein DICPUDRAFT_43095 [Dictyostelium purpureum]|eukprot:XP_003294211.1 hypothetical protein DICPUDRAFT_43095 [Dictyostelium purpureum]